MRLYEYMKQEILSNISFLKRMEAIILAQIGKRIPIIINDNGTSYTNSKEIVLSTQEAILNEADSEFKDTPEILQSYFIGLALHEAEHVISSDFEKFSQYINFVANDYQKQYNVPLQIGRKIGVCICNSMEDGRIERRAVNRLPVAKKHIQILNYIDYLGATCNEDKVLAILNNITSMSVRGKLIRGTKKLFNKTDVWEVLQNVKKIIFNAVREDNSDKAFELYYKAHYATRGIIGPELLNEDKLDELEEQLMDMLSELEDINESMQNKENDNCGNQISSHFDTNKDEQKEEGQAEENKESSKGSESSNDKDDKKASSNDELSDDKDELSKDFMDSLLNEIKNKQEEDKINNELYAQRRKKEDSTTEAEVSRKEMSEISRIMSGNVIDMSRKSVHSLSESHDCKIEGKKLELQIQKILQNKKKEKIYNLRRGNMNRKSLTRLISKNDDRLFYKKEVEEIEDYVVSIMIDDSGSMSRYKLGHALASAAILEEGLKNLVPLKIMAFNSDSYITNIFLLKKFNENRKESVLYCGLKADDMNCDAFALEYAYLDLQKRSEKNKILFFVTDGQPSKGILKNPIIDTIEAVRKLRKNGIQVIPIAITNSYVDISGEYEAFHQLYGNRFIFTTSDNLSVEISKYLKKTIR